MLFLCPYIHYKDKSESKGNNFEIEIFYPFDYNPFVIILFFIIIYKIIVAYRRGIDRNYCNNLNITNSIYSFLKNGSIIASVFDSTGVQFSIIEPFILTYFILLLEHPDKLKYLFILMIKKLFITDKIISSLIILLFQTKTNDDNKYNFLNNNNRNNYRDENNNNISKNNKELKCNNNNNEIINKNNNNEDNNNNNLNKNKNKENYNNGMEDEKITNTSVNNEDSNKFNNSGNSSKLSELCVNVLLKYIRIFCLFVLLINLSIISVVQILFHFYYLNNQLHYDVCYFLKTINLSFSFFLSYF